MPEGTYQVIQDLTNLVLCIYQEMMRLQAAWLADQSFDEFRVSLPASLCALTLSTILIRLEYSVGA
jgi:hypothetical protein